MNTKKKLEKIYNEYGFDFSDPKEILELDSVDFISFVIDIEEEFEINFPDEFLNKEFFINTQLVLNLIEDLL